MTADDGEVRRANDIGKHEGRKLSPRAIVGLVIAGLVLAFALVNFQDASVDFGVNTVTMPLFFVIAVTLGLGFGAGVLFARHRRRQRD